MVLGKFTEGATVIPRATQLLLTVQFALKSVSGLPWNRCPDSRGIRNHDSGLLIDRLRAIDNRRLSTGPLARLPVASMDEVYRAIAEVLEIPD